MAITKILIDTNIYIEAMRGNREMAEKLKTVDMIGISVISIGELLAGVKLQAKPEKYASQLKEFLDTPRVDYCHLLISQPISIVKFT